MRFVETPEKHCMLAPVVGDNTRNDRYWDYLMRKVRILTVNCIARWWLPFLQQTKVIAILSDKNGSFFHRKCLGNSTDLEESRYYCVRRRFQNKLTDIIRFSSNVVERLNTRISGPLLCFGIAPSSVMGGHIRCR